MRSTPVGRTDGWPTSSPQVQRCRIAATVLRLMPADEATTPDVFEALALDVDTVRPDGAGLRCTRTWPPSIPAAARRQDGHRHWGQPQAGSAAAIAPSRRSRRGRVSHRRPHSWRPSPQPGEGAISRCGSRHALYDRLSKWTDTRLCSLCWRLGHSASESVATSRQSASRRTRPRPT
jgi:hypothetical protein